MIGHEKNDSWMWSSLFPGHTSVALWLCGKFRRCPKAARGDRAFTVIELLMVVAIIGLMSMTAVPYGQFAYIREMEEQLRNSLEDIQTAINRWRSDCEKTVKENQVPDEDGILNIPEYCFYPPDIGALTTNTPHVISYGAYTITFYHLPYLSKLPPDPFVGRAAWIQHYARQTLGESETTWDNGVVLPAPVTPPVPPDVIPPNRVGVFTVSPLPGKVDRRDFLVAIDGSKYEDW